MFLILNMRFTKPVIFFFSILILSTAGFAQTVTGCRIGNDNFLYTNYQGIQSYPVSQWYQPTFPTYTSPTKPFLQDWYNDYSSCPRFVGNPSYGAQCAVQGITIASGGWVQHLGLTITYTLSYQCPIDNEVFVLLTGVGIFSVYFIRREII